MNNRLLFTALLALALSGRASAQAPRPGRMAPKPRVVATGVGLKDGLMMQKGRVVLTEAGITNPLAADKKLLNGTTISPAGIVAAPDGSTVQMAEGDMVSLTGRVTTRTSIMEADSLLKIKAYDLKFPGKRKKMEAERERREKMKIKLEEKKAKGKRG